MQFKKNFHTIGKTCLKSVPPDAENFGWVSGVQLDLLEKKCPISHEKPRWGKIRAYISKINE